MADLGLPILNSREKEVGEGDLWTAVELWGSTIELDTTTA